MEYGVGRNESAQVLAENGLWTTTPPRFRFVQFVHTLLESFCVPGALHTKPGQGTFDLNDPRILVAGEPTARSSTTA